MKYLITSALPYINGIKHLGNLVGSMLPADVCARYLRARGHEVLFVCATDEHGTPTEIAARKAGLPVEQFCIEQHEVQKEIYNQFSLSFDYFGRSSNKSNHKRTQYFADLLEQRGFIEERTMQQYYSTEDTMFLPDRYIEGICPYCGYENARGDQCEKCTKVLDPEDLVSPRSAISGSTKLELRDTKHLFLLQSKLVDEIQKWLKTKEAQWPKLVLAIANKWIKDGLNDRCITRDLKWGVPVKKKGFEDKVFYVWFDAPIAYIASTQDWADLKPEERDWFKWWDPTSSEVAYYQFMAKDNIPFHSISFPATIIGSGNTVRLVDRIKGFNWLNYYGEKFSTSQKRGIFMDDAIKLYPSDYWRYYLLRNIPENDDVSFSWESFAETVNKDLADILGNFVNRSYKMQIQYSGQVLQAGGSISEAENILIRDVSELKTQFEKAMDNLEFRKAGFALRSVWKAANEYCDNRSPWKAFKEGRLEDVNICMRYLFNMQRLISILSEPFIPDLSRSIADALCLSPEERFWPSSEVASELQVIRPGRIINDPNSVLVKKITKEDVVQHEIFFRGNTP